MKTTPSEDDRKCQEGRPRRALAECDPGDEPDDQHLQIAQHGRQAGADRSDRQVPRHQVAHEEQAGDGRQADRASRQRARTSPLGEGHEYQQRQAEDGPEDGPGRRGNGRVQVEDPGERDADRAKQGRQPGSGGEPVQRTEAQAKLGTGRRRRRGLAHAASAVRPSCREDPRSAGPVPRTDRVPAPMELQAWGPSRTASSGRP